MKNKHVRTGERPGEGIYKCTNCGTEISLTEDDKMPPCPRCTNTSFERD